MVSGEVVASLWIYLSEIQWLHMFSRAHFACKRASSISCVAVVNALKAKKIAQGMYSIQKGAATGEETDPKNNRRTNKPELSAYKRTVFARR